MVDQHMHTIIHKYPIPTFLALYLHTVMYRGGKVQYTGHSPQSSSATEHCPVYE